MTAEDIKAIGTRYANGKNTGWDVDPATGATIVYAIRAIYFEGKYYSMVTGKPISISKDNYIKDIRNNMREGHRHDAIEGTGTGIIVRKTNNSNHEEFLLQLRFDVNQYGLFGGNLELGETYPHCAARELLEEAALIVNEEDLHLENVYGGPKHVTRYPSGDLVFHTIIVYSIDYEKCTELGTKFDTETKQLRWFSKEELKFLLKNEPERFFPNNYPILLDVVSKFFS